MMAFGNINSSNSINLKNMKKYTANNNASNVFKEKFYTNIDIKDVDVYENINNQYSIDIAKTRTLMEEQVNQKSIQEDKWWQAGLEYAGVFFSSAVTSFLNLGEGVIDGHIYAVSKPLQFFGLGIDDKWVEDLISYDVSSKIYDAIMEQTGIDKKRHMDQYMQ